MGQETTLLSSHLSLLRANCITRDDLLEGVGQKMSGGQWSHSHLEFTSEQWREIFQQKKKIFSKVGPPA